MGLETYEQIANRLNRAQKLLKVSKQKDYYKVGGGFFFGGGPRG